jgi:hypothetical protein
VQALRRSAAPNSQICSGTGLTARAVWRCCTCEQNNYQAALVRAVLTTHLAVGPQQSRLTLRSSGPPPAWHLAREAVQVIIRLAGQAPHRRRPLTSNVRPHQKLVLADAALRVVGFQMQTRSCSWKPLFAPGQAVNSCIAKPDEQMHCRRSLSAPSRLAGLAQAARPLAGGSPDFARGRAVQTGRSVAALANHGYVWYESEHANQGHTLSLRGCAAPVLMSASNPWLGQLTFA